MNGEGFQIGRPVALVGLMGAGKSTVGRILADQLGIDFVDTDLEIEKSTGLKIRILFEGLGEAAFRKKEREIVHGLDLSRPRVLATGGGVFADEELRRRVLETCFTIWLDCQVSVLVDRVQMSTTRPLLKVSDPLPALERLAAERSPAYALADVRVDSGDGTPEQIADVIVQALKERRP